MSREKVAALAAMSPPELAAYKAKRNQRSYWQSLDHKEWATFCKIMGKWFTESATDEWDKFVKANALRKAKSDIEALARKNGR